MYKLKCDREVTKRIRAAASATMVDATQNVLQNVAYTRQLLTPEQLNIVNTMFSERGITVSSRAVKDFRVPSPHAAVAAATEVLQHIVEKRTAGYSVIHAGGTAMDHIVGGNHVCQVVGDARNGVRLNEYERTCAKMSNSRYKTQRERAGVLARDLRLKTMRQGEAMCFSGVENCQRDAHFIVFNNSHYDLSFSALGKAMRAHGSKTAYLIGIHPREMLVPTLLSGRDIDFGISWRHTADSVKDFQPTIDAKVLVDFNDGSNAYVHSRADYIKWIANTAWSDGKTNLVFEVEYYGPFAIIKVDNVLTPGSITREIRFENPMTIIPDAKYFLGDTYGYQPFKPTNRWHHVSQSLWARLEGYAAAKTDQVWTFPAFASYVRAQANVLALEAGEWRTTRNSETTMVLTGDALVSAFIWLAVLRMQRSKIIGKAYNLISSELNEDNFIDIILRKYLAAPAAIKYNAFKEWMVGRSILEPEIRDDHGQVIVSTLRGTVIEECHSVVQYDEPEEVALEEVISEGSIPEIVNRAIAEYVKKIAPAENQQARAELAARNDDDPETNMFVLVESATRKAMTANVGGASFNVTIVEGGPGTGKTQYECDNVLAGDVVIVPTRKAKAELEARLKLNNKNNKVLTPHAALDWALTDQPKCEKLYVDEAFLQYPGLAFLVAHHSEAREVVLVGDSKQIRPKDFAASGAHTTCHALIGLAERKFLRDNYRLPAAQVEIINRRFGYDMVAKSRVAGEIQIINAESHDELHGADEVEARLDAASFIIITLSQRLKDEYRNHGYTAYTAHEYQGSGARRVAFIVGNDIEQNFIDDIGYFIVAFTRNTQDLYVCRVTEAGGVRFADIKIGNTDLECLTDLLAPVASIEVFKETVVRAEVIADGALDLNVNFDIGFLEETFGNFWRTTTIANDVLRSTYRRRVPAAAERVRIRPELITNDEIQLDVYMFGDFCYLADQFGGNALAMIDTFVTRNGGARTLLDRSVAEAATRHVIKLKRSRMFRMQKPQKLTIEELSEAFSRFVEKMIERKKSGEYNRALTELMDIDRLRAFMKTQLKSKWEPSKEGYAELQNFCASEAVGAAIDGKAGQGVVGWSKPLCYVYAAWIGAIETRWESELLPFVVYATRLSENHMVAKINSVLLKYKKAILVKGDDVAIIFSDEQGNMRSICWDAAKFDSTQATAVMVAQAYEMGLYGMPHALLQHYFNFMANAHIKSMCGILDMTLHFSRHSGGYETLWGNTNYSMNLIACALELSHDTDWRVAKMSTRGVSFLKRVFGAELKLHESGIGDFVGYLIKDWRMYPDVFRLSAKLLNRRFVDRCDVPLATRRSYAAACPSLVRDRATRDTRIQLYHSLTQYQVAVHDRIFSSILTSDMHQGCVAANAAFYLPNVPGADGIVSHMLDILGTFGQLRYTPIYFDRLLPRLTTMHILPIDNEHPADQLSHHIFDKEASEQLLVSSGLLGNMLINPEADNVVTAVDPGWARACRGNLEKLKACFTTVAQRLRSVAHGFLSRLRFLQRWDLTRRIIDHLRVRSLEAVEVEEEEDFLEPSDDEDEDLIPDEINEEIYRDERRAERYADLGRVVAKLVEEDPRCCTTMAHWIPRRRFVSKAAYKALDLLPPDLAEDFEDETNRFVVIDIGAAPGGMSQVFCQFPGVMRVTAITLPDRRMEFHNDKLDLIYTDIKSIGQLPQSDFISCDMQGVDAPTFDVLKALCGEVPHYIKMQHFDADILRHCQGRRFVKPLRSNRYSSEVYYVSYDHPGALTFDEYLDTWEGRLGALRRREIPAPLANQDNLRYALANNLLSDAFRMITNSEREIRSALELSESLRRAGISHTISHGRELLYEFIDRSFRGYWNIDTETNECERIAEPKEKKPSKGRAGSTVSGSSDGSIADPDEMPPAPIAIADFLGAAAAAAALGAGANAIIEGTVEMNIVAERCSTLMHLFSPFFEELAASYVKRRGAIMHPAALYHALAGMKLMHGGDMPGAGAQFGVAGTLQRAFKAPMLYRWLNHFINNAAARGLIHTKYAHAAHILFDHGTNGKFRVACFAIALIFPQAGQVIDGLMSLRRMYLMFKDLTKQLLHAHSGLLHTICAGFPLMMLSTPAAIVVNGGIEQLVNKAIFNFLVPAAATTITAMNTYVPCVPKSFVALVTPLAVAVTNTPLAVEDKRVAAIFEPVVNAVSGVKVQNSPANPFFTAPVGLDASARNKTITVSHSTFINPFTGNYPYNFELWGRTLADAYDAGFVSNYSTDSKYLIDCVVTFSATAFTWTNEFATSYDLQLNSSGQSLKYYHEYHRAGDDAAKVPNFTALLGKNYMGRNTDTERASFNVTFDAFQF